MTARRRPWPVDERWDAATTELLPPALHDTTRALRDVAPRLKRTSAHPYRTSGATMQVLDSRIDIRLSAPELVALKRQCQRTRRSVAGVLRSLIAQYVTGAGLGVGYGLGVV